MSTYISMRLENTKEKIKLEELNDMMLETIKSSP